MCYEAELFLARGAARKLITSWVGIGLPWGTSKLFRTFVEEGRVEYEEWSHLSLGLRFLAGAMGMPFLPTRSLLGSDLLSLRGLKQMEDPYTGERVCLVPALVPDVALIHVHRSDPLGNAQIDGAPYLDAEIAAASRRVILTTERVVSTEAIVAEADRTLIPHLLVDAVVEVPYGSFPHECYGLYEASFEHFDHYTELAAGRGTDGILEYVRQVVDEPGSFSSFIADIGAETLRELERRAAELVSS
jgi:glutaconate CoA-transferase subunit A